MRATATSHPCELSALGLSIVHCGLRLFVKTTDLKRTRLKEPVIQNSVAVTSLLGSMTKGVQDSDRWQASICHYGE